jgi:hypothetical protein
MRRESRHYRIGLAPVLLTKGGECTPPRGLPAGSARILAYNSRLERHHLGLNLSSLLFWRGVPIDRIYLRQRWWPWRKRERSVVLEGHWVLEGRACSDEHRRVAVSTPYFPYPLAHGGAARIYYLVRQMAEEFDVELFAFLDKSGPPETAPSPMPQVSRCWPKWPVSTPCVISTGEL